MKSLVSKPLLAGLLATVVVTVITVLKPDVEPAVSGDTLLVDSRGRTALVESEPETPWLRTLPAQQIAHLDRGFVPPPPPPPPPVVVVPVELPKPVTPTPAFTYLGRMTRDDRVYVFLGHGEEVDVVAIGEAIDSDWRVEGLTDTGISLRYLPLNEVRQLAMSGN